MLRGWRNKTLSYTGPKDTDEVVDLPIGLSRVTTTGFVAFAFINPENKEVIAMFSLEPGKEHVVNRPEGVLLLVECEKKVKWVIRYSNRFNKADPTRIEAPLVRPLSPQEEMQSYFNEVAARALGREYAQKLRQGEAMIDTSQDDYSEEHPDDDALPPLTKEQLGVIIDEIQMDMVKLKKSETQKDIEEEAPPKDLKRPKGVKESGPKGKTQNSPETGEVEQE